MHRHIVLDIETTGLNIIDGHRIIEIGCVEIKNRQITGNNLHYYINPGRDSEKSALAIHGLTTKFLKNKLKFSEIVDNFLNYVSNSEIIIHNAAFDVGFLDMELSLLGYSNFTKYIYRITDTLLMARKIHTGKRNSLDALCDRYNISKIHRTLHGGLLDAELLAEVYLAMTRGQSNLNFKPKINNSNNIETKIKIPNNIPIKLANSNELVQHNMILSKIDKHSNGRCIWKK
ncbi:DNA polymerase III subunit epsilon [Candidatus Profftella armatura]|uniref:DNA polymerase III subunit epsilon n=1 Tax=Candidatus Profftella armatura TaxID=669502 RepID=UPI0015DCEDE9|nr:DNA polymerase III subunit epsilon [Candidatus Profftella armatura]QLK13862.1 DNA polymerase III subunit epsilon [Candidatus Profftella armatura]